MKTHINEDGIYLINEDGIYLIDENSEVENIIESGDKFLLHDGNSVGPYIEEFDEQFNTPVYSIDLAAITPKRKLATVRNEEGILFNVMIIERGHRYGLKDCLIHDEDDPLIEFYDTRFLHTEHGQFVSRYYLSTLQEIEPNIGLNLGDGVPDWNVSAANIQDIKDIIEIEFSQRKGQ